MVNYLVINDYKYPVRVSYYVLKHFKIETGRDLENFDNFSDIEVLLYYALIAGHKAENKEFHISRDDFEFFVDGNLKEIITQLPVLMADLKSAISGEEDTKKKKAK